MIFCDTHSPSGLLTYVFQSDFFFANDLQIFPIGSIMRNRQQLREYPRDQLFPNIPTIPTISKQLYQLYQLY